MNSKKTPKFSGTHFPYFSNYEYKNVHAKGSFVILKFSRKQAQFVIWLLKNYLRKKIFLKPDC